MEKDVARRYPTAQALADDLRRFAEDRPILSRRIGLAEKTVKWVRRHKAVTTALVAVVAALAASAGWVVSTVVENRRQGNALLHSAYDGLVHMNFDRAKEATAILEQAEALGADESRSELLWALVNTIQSDGEAAIERLDRLLERDPENIEALYILAWTQYRQQRRDQSRVIFQKAEELGGPRSAEEWFFRALAVHREDAAEALESYRTAAELHAENNLIFPQAEVQLARADNQLMYETRTLDPFEEAESVLRNLMRLKHYRGYPYYLLSITHRLAAEIHLGQPQEFEESEAEERFTEALYWARKGQEHYPNDNRPATAAAMCLERLGRFEEALATRGQAIELARQARIDAHECENYRYRWRLHYWLGGLDDALRDLSAYTELLPDAAGSVRASRHRMQYTHLYPALVHAETGNLEGGLELVRAAAEETSSDAQAIVLCAAFLHVLGSPDEAQEMLENHMDDVDFAAGLATYQSAEWVETLYAYAAGEVEFEALEDEVEESPHARRLLGEAHFHAGAKALAAGRRPEARNDFDRAYRSFNGSINLSFSGRIILGKLDSDMHWPRWIHAAVGDEIPAGGVERSQGDASFIGGGQTDETDH
jgi:tetratricopeptide (TPR) repeat protein